MPTPLVIQEMWAWIATGEDGEGVVAAPMPPSLGNGIMPLVGADRDRIESLRSVAQQIADKFDQSLKLVKFSVREEIEEIHPS